MTDISKALLYSRPGEAWSLNGDTIDGLTWLSDTKPPTKAEIDAAWISYEAARQQAEADALAARESALAKLAALGLTVDDVTALGL